MNSRPLPRTVRLNYRSAAVSQSNAAHGLCRSGHRLIRHRTALPDHHDKLGARHQPVPVFGRMQDQAEHQRLYRNPVSIAAQFERHRIHGMRSGMIGCVLVASHMSSCNLPPFIKYENQNHAHILHILRMET